MAQNQYVNNFSLFDSLDYGGTSAPKYEPEYEPVSPSRKKTKTDKNKKTNNKKNTSKSVRQNRSATVKRAEMTKAQKELAAHTRFIAVVSMCVAVVFVSLFACMLGLNSQIDEKITKINSVQNQIDEAKSDQVRLEAELDALVSIDKIDDYALNVLGMIKLEDYKITYIENQDDNHVVISGGKSYSNNAVSAKFIQLREYFSK